MIGDYKEIIKNRSFVFLWISQVLSQMTIFIMVYVLLIELFHASGSSIATSLIWVAYSIPVILVGPIASALADMSDRKRILIITNLLQCITIILFSLSYGSNLFLVYGFIIIYSFLNQFYVPSESASIPSIVKKANLPYANSLFFLTQQTALIFGFGVAGIIYQILGLTHTLYLCAGFIFIAFISVNFLPKMTVRNDDTANFEETFIKFFTRIYEGYLFIKNKKIVLTPILILLVFQMALAVIMVNIPFIASSIVNISVNYSGVLLILPAGVGAVIGAIGVPKMLKRLRKKSVIENFLFLMILSLFVLNFIVPELNFFLRITISILSIMMMGISFVGIIIPCQTTIQEHTPYNLRGRVFGNFWFLSTMATVLPVIFSGTITEIFGIRLLLFIIGGVILSVLVLSKKMGHSYIKDNF